MKGRLCPICSGDLKLLASKCEELPISAEDYEVLHRVAPIKDNLSEVNIEVVTGALTCRTCRVYYPIYSGVPRMLTYPTEVAHAHRAENASWIEENLPDLTLPRCEVPPGEQAVLRNFSTEWTEYRWSGESYWSSTPEQVSAWMRFSLATNKYPLKGKLALEVGPTLSRLPQRIQTVVLTAAVPVYIVYQNVVRKKTAEQNTAISYGWTEALHAARDRLTPPFVHRHTYEEVADWFRAEQYGRLEFLCDDALPPGFPDNLQVCVGIRGFSEQNRSALSPPAPQRANQSVKAAQSGRVA
jgi:uncharacterized protein YbaR (Trm112 family)